MASIVQRIMNFINSPKGREAMDRGKRELGKPDNQAKLRRLTSRFKGGNRR